MRIYSAIVLRNRDTYLFLLLVKVVDDDTNKEIQSEEGAEDYEDHKIYIHVDIVLIDWLVINLKTANNKTSDSPDINELCARLHHQLKRK